MDNYYKNYDIIYRIGTDKFRKLCSQGMKATQMLGEVDKALLEKGISTISFTPEDYKKAIDNLSIASYYGIEFDITNRSPICTRIGDMTLHRTLPVHSKMRGCLLADDGTVVKYLNSEDWRSEPRDGSLGQVMVEVPEFWIKFETDGNKRRVYLSERPIASFKRVPKFYVSAYEAAWDRTNNLLCSVASTDPRYRGGNNQANWDGTHRSMLGMPATNRTRAQFLEAARKRDPSSYKWIDLSYDIYKNLFWLYYVEYANFNSQTAYTGERDANGYRQGGLGMGVTTVNMQDCNNFTGGYPFIPCGYTDSLGNSTGIVRYDFPIEMPNTSIKFVNVPRWRGVENIFGHLWKYCNGIVIEVQSDSAGGESKVYVFDSPEHYADSVTEHAIFKANLPRTQGYIAELAFGDDGDIIPKVTVNASTNAYFCDFFSTVLPTQNNSSLCLALFGGSFACGAGSGFGYLSSGFLVVTVGATWGARLCYLTEY